MIFDFICHAIKMETINDERKQTLSFVCRLNTLENIKRDSDLCIFENCQGFVYFYSVDIE